MFPVAALIGGLLYRLRGGWLNDLMGWGQKTQLSRLAWAIPTAALMTEMSHGPWWLWPMLAVSIFGGQALFGTGQYLPANATVVYPDLLGFYRNALSATPVFYFSPQMFAALAIVGSAHSALYWLGHRTGYASKAGEVIVGAVSWSVIVLCR